MEEDVNDVEHVDDNKKIPEEIVKYTTLKKTYTLSSNDNTKIEGKSDDMNKDYNGKVDEVKRIPEDIVEYSIVKAKVFQTKVI